MMNFEAAAEISFLLALVSFDWFDWFLISVAFVRNCVCMRFAQPFDLSVALFFIRVLIDAHTFYDDSIQCILYVISDTINLNAPLQFARRCQKNANWASNQLHRNTAQN